MKRRILSLALALACALGLASPALAAESRRAAFPSAREVFLEGVPVDFLVSERGKYPPFTCDGTVYIPLMTAGRWLGADAVWDEKAGTVTIASNGAAPVFDTVTGLLTQGIGFQWGGEQLDQDRAKGVPAQLCPDVSVTIDGQKTSICPLLLRGFLYLPLQSVGELLGKAVLQYGGSVYLYQAPTEEALAEAEASLSAIHGHLNAVRAAVTRAEPKTGEEFTARAKEVQDHLKAAYALPTPAFQTIGYGWKELHSWLEWTLVKLVDGYLPPEESSGVAESQGGQPSRPWFLSSPHIVKEKWDRFSGGILPAPGQDSYFLYAERQCSKLEQLLTAIAQSPARTPSGGEPPPASEKPLPGEDVPSSGAAYAAAQPVLVDGKAVEFPCYALKNAKGDPTNYVKLRDVALVLNGTAAQFSVEWDGAVNIGRGMAYAPNGSELSAPFSGDRAYQKAEAETRIDGKAAALAAIVLTDDRGGAYTYYKLRDLGTALGFRVDWDTEKGVFIETK